jgi:hypothetical protein
MSMCKFIVTLTLMETDKKAPDDWMPSLEKKPGVEIAIALSPNDCGLIV